LKLSRLTSQSRKVYRQTKTTKYKDKEKGRNLLVYTFRQSVKLL